MSIDPHRVLFEDEHLLAVNKLCGELAVKGRGAVGKLPLLDFLKEDYPGLTTVHRLDFETSGILLFAKRKEVARNILDTKFDQWTKKYRCLVAGRIERGGGVIQKRLPTRHSARDARNAADLVDAKTTYTVLERFGNSTSVEAVIETGRHHQIRRHFAAIGHPLVLDHVYGDRKFNALFTREFGYRKFFLHAAEASFPHPVTGERVAIAVPLPRVFEEVLRKLRAC